MITNHLTRILQYCSDKKSDFQAKLYIDKPSNNICKRFIPLYCSVDVSHTKFNSWMDRRGGSYHVRKISKIQRSAPCASPADMITAPPNPLTSRAGILFRKMPGTNATVGPAWDITHSRSMLHQNTSATLSGAESPMKLRCASRVQLAVAHLRMTRWALVFICNAS